MTTSEKNKPSAQQYSFHTCQKCRQVVEQVYQNGYCFDCLQEQFASLRHLINTSHAMHNIKKDR